MSKYAAVNVKFGADISQFSTAMQNAAREMKKVGDQLSNVGRSMTMNLTAPIVALGAAALYSFGQIDSLKRGLISFSGSASLAEDEFNKLREVAKLPGIGLEEAVKGSINLQAIGISADEARKDMMAFGNAIATIGGGKENFDLAIRGFSQLTNASKPLQQDLYQIANQLPQINKILIDTFGTNRADELAAMGISGKQLADVLVTELGKLPQVSGGIKNSFENMTDSVKISLASFGDAIEKNFNISGKINELSTYLSNLVSKFSALNPNTQKFILSWVAAAAAIGPVLLSIGTIIKLFPLLTAGFTGLTTVVTVAKTAMNALTLSMNANWVVALTGAVVLAIIAFKNWGDAAQTAAGKLKEQREEAKKLREEAENAKDPFYQSLKNTKKAEIDVKPQKNSYEDFRKNAFNKPVEKGQYLYMGEVKEPEIKKKTDAKPLTAEEQAAIKKAGLERSAKMIESYKDSQIAVDNAMRQADSKKNDIKFDSDLQRIFDGRANIVSTGWIKTTEAFSKGIAGFTSEMAIKKGLMLQQLDKLNQELTSMLNAGLVDGITSAFSQIGENIAMSDDPFKNVGKTLLSSLGKLMATMGAAMVAWGVAQLEFETSIATLNPIGAIAAGAAMVAAGAAISATANKGLKGASSGSSGGYTGGSSTSNNGFTLTSRLDGRDLILSGQETSRVKRR